MQFMYGNTLKVTCVATFAVSKRKPEKFSYMIFIFKKGINLAITPLLIFL